MRLGRAAVALLLASLTGAACADRPEMRAEPAFGDAVLLFPDQAYARAHPRQRLDVYVPRDLPHAPPLLVYVHGGGWMDGRKEEAQLAIAPYLASGWAVANVEYRTGREASAPAAVEDVACAVKWIAANAARFGVAAGRMVLAGHSAGGHLVLMAALADAASSRDGPCPGAMPPISGAIDWAGPTDVNDLLAGAHRRGWATGWIGDAPGAEERARAVSPLSHVRRGLPPVLIVHGDADSTVPLDHSVRLHAALRAAGVDAELEVLRGAGHGPLGPEDAAIAWAAVQRFLAARATGSPPASPR